MAASLLASGEVELLDIPRLRDVQTLQKLLSHLGVDIQEDGASTRLRASGVQNFSARYDIVKTMRASILVLGPLLSRHGMAQVSLPGGCAIGTRPIDLHLEGLRQLGADISIVGGDVRAQSRGRLRGNRIPLPTPSVGATENLMMAAALAQGETLIGNAAREPEITDLAEFINAMGGQVSGAGTSTIRIQGVDDLRGCQYRPIADRIEAATYLLAGLICRGPITVDDCNPGHLQSVLRVLEQMGCRFSLGEHSIQITPHWDFHPTYVETGPDPQFPTDVQAQMMAFLTTVEGKSSVVETIFENRFMHVAGVAPNGGPYPLASK